MSEVTWGALHVGDVVRGRDGHGWAVLSRAASADRWLAGGGAGRQDMFELQSAHDGRVVKAARPLGEVLTLLSRADRSEEQRACDALAAAGITTTLIREGDMSTDVASAANTCSHPADTRSVLKDGRHYCTTCFETTHTPDGTFDNMIVETRGPEVLVTPLAERFGVDESGNRWPIPPTVTDAESCTFRVHPVDFLTPLPTGVLGCELCTFAGIPDAPAHVHDPVKIIDGSTWCRDCKQTLLDAPVAGDVVTVAIDGYEAVNNAAALDEIVAFERDTVLSDPAPTVATVTVISEPAPPPVDVFSDPAPRASASGAYEPPRDQWGRYKLPHPVTGVVQGWTRATTLARVLADTYKLEQWAQRQVVMGLATAPDLIALAASVKPEDDDARKTLNEIVKKALDRVGSDSGARLGTALHAFTHRRARGESLAELRAPADLVPDLVEYEAAMKRHRLVEDVQLVERIVVNTKVGAAGTFDRIVRQPSGNVHAAPMSVLDLKTSKSLDFSSLEISIQLAIYAHADYMWQPDPAHPAGGTYVEMPPGDVLDRFRALVLHLPVGKGAATLWAYNIDEGWRYAQLAEQARQARNGSKGLSWLVEPDPETLLIHRVSRAADQAELAAMWERYHPAGEWSDAVQAAAVERLARLAAVSP